MPVHSTHSKVQDLPEPLRAFRKSQSIQGFFFAQQEWLVGRSGPVPDHAPDPTFDQQSVDPPFRMV